MRHRFIRHAAPLLANAPRTVVAVSGGGDSMALLHLLLESRLIPRDRLTVAHFDHNLRPDSHQDARFVAQAADRLALHLVTERWEHGRVAGNTAADARDARLAFLSRTARATDATHIATGHHRDDQAETFLERLLRGGGVTGLAAMRPQRPLEDAREPPLTLVRPLLAFTREELETWLTSQDVSWLTDPGNRNQTRRRNRIRMQGIPCLEEIGDHGVSQRLAATAQRMGRADAALEWMLDRCWPELDADAATPGVITLAHAPLAALPDELLCRCLLRCHRDLTGNAPPPGSRALDGFLRLMRSRRRSWRMDLHGLGVQRERNRITIVRQSGRMTRTKTGQMVDSRPS